MLDKLLDALKKNLPGAKKVEESEFDEEEVEESDDGVDEVSNSKDDAKKKSSPLIKIIIIIAVGYLAFDFLMPKDDDVNIDQMIQTPIPKKKKKKITREEAANQADLASPAESEPVKNDGQQGNTAATVATSNDEDLSKAIDSIPTEVQKEATAPDLTSAPVEEINILKTVESGDSEINNGPLVDKQSSGLGEGSSVEKKSKSDETNSLESKIVAQLEYIAPPKYESLGRGLVYNCKGKHWACVDKESYQVCYKNMKFNSENAKPSECITQNVYANEEDCNTIQRYNVSTSVATSFCQ